MTLVSPPSLEALIHGTQLSLHDGESFTSIEDQKRTEFLGITPESKLGDSSQQTPTVWELKSNLSTCPGPW